MNRKERRAAQKRGGGLATPPGPAPGDPFALAVQHFREGRLAEAKRACEQALAREPGHFDALTMLGLIAMRAGRTDIAADLFGRAVGVDNASPDAHFHLGFAFASLERVDDAARHLSRAIDLNPAFTNAMIGLGNVRKQQGDLEAAAVQYRRALAIRPDATAHYNLANVLRTLGRLDEAVASYKAALDEGERSPELLSNLALTLAVQGKPDEALSAFEDALALRPDHPEVLANLAAFHFQRGGLDEAATLYRRAVAARPDSVEARNGLGTVLIRQGGFAAARECLAQALELAPGAAETQLNLCVALYGLGQHDREAALAHAHRLLETHGDQPLLQRGLAGLMGRSVDADQDSAYSRALFDQFAASFDSTLVGLGYLDLLHEMAEAAAAGSGGAAWDILDAGCGTGLCGPLFKPAARTLTGVDLSPRMIDQGRVHALYDNLVIADIGEFMAAHPAAFDLIVSSDVLTYMGDLPRYLQAAHVSLRDGGRLAISVESLDEEGEVAGYRLAASGRYKHSRSYVEDCFGKAGFALCAMRATTMRKEAGRDVAAWIAIGEKR